MSPQPDHGENSYRGSGKLTSKVALVTGADSGIGRAVALAFAREGADVAIGYLDEQGDANETARLVKEAGRKALLVPGDISKDSACAEIVRRTVEAFGRIDVLVNNAAFQGDAISSFEELDAARVTKTLMTNVGGLFNMTRHALPHMKAGGTIINTASINAYQPKPSILDYGVTKGAIVTFTKGLALEMAKRGIRVNAVAPGPVWTPLIAQSFKAEEVAKFGSNNPMGRPAQPAEVAPAYVFLASDDSRFVNAEILGVTGGGILG